MAHPMNARPGDDEHEDREDEPPEDDRHVDVSAVFIIGALFGSLTSATSLFGLLSDLLNLRLSLVVSKVLASYRAFFAPLVDYVTRIESPAVLRLPDDVIILICICGAIVVRSQYVSAERSEMILMFSREPLSMAKRVWNEFAFSILTLFGIGLMLIACLLVPLVNYLFSFAIVFFVGMSMAYVAGLRKTPPMQDAAIARLAGMSGWGTIFCLPLFFVINAYGA